MFDSRHYVPILKWKRAEQKALKSLPDRINAHVTPLIQLVMPKIEIEDLNAAVKKFEELMPAIPSQIKEVWGSKHLFLDVSLLFTTELKVKTALAVLSDQSKNQTSMVPVIHLGDEAEIQDAIFSIARKNGTGFCIRLICADFRNLETLSARLQQVVSASGVAKGDIDLLVDIKETEGSEEKYLRYLESSQLIPDLLEWRTYTFASGSFPVDLSECKIDEENLIERIDWRCWKKALKSQQLKRIPTFSDYTIQYPKYDPQVQGFHPTASLKYALEEDWLVMKGKRQKFEDYLAHAATLTVDERYFGEHFSDGDGYIAQKARHFDGYIRAKNEGKDIKGTGTPETWLQAGINHHVSLVATQVSTLT